MAPRAGEVLARLSSSERRMAAFVVGWALLGALASALPWRASFSSDGREPVVIPPGDPRSALHAQSAALAAHLALARMPPSSPLDPNRASREELDRLPGVGPKTALSWVQARSSGGPFFALTDLQRVRGLGPKRLEGLAPYVRFEARLADSRPRDGPAETVDLNRATESELTTLPRIGPVLARRIIAHRSGGRRFRSPADLDSVPGVGPALLEGLAGRVRFE